MKSKKWLVVILVLLGILIAGGVAWDHLSEQHDEETIQIAKHTEIASGVTLEQGFKALFGNSGSWFPEGGNDVYVMIYASDMNFSGDDHTVTATFHVDTKTQNLDVVTFEFDGTPVSNAELDEILNDMVQAAKGQ